MLRYFNLYGRGQEHSSYGGVITRFLQNALNDEPLVVYGDGKQTRDFIYVDNVVEATMLALENNDLECEALNICTGRPTAINELVQILKDVSGRNLGVV